MAGARQKKGIGTPTALTIAGSDSCCGAGIQADLQTFDRLGVRGASAITCITAQNPRRVSGIEPVSPSMIRLQMLAVCEDGGIVAAKTGMLYSARIIAAVAGAIRECGIRRLVVDPVMIATSGARLLRKDAVSAIKEKLLPLAELITPNIPEAEFFCGKRIKSAADAAVAAETIGRRWKTSCVVKGGHLPGGKVVNTLFHQGKTTTFSISRVRVTSTHGTGCVFSAAATAMMSRGASVPAAIEAAGRHVADVLRAGTW